MNTNFTVRPGWVPRLKKSGKRLDPLNPRCDGGFYRRGGSGVSHLKRGSMISYDLVISNANKTRKNMSNCHLVAGVAAEVAYKRKVSQYSKRYLLPVDSFFPLACETGGRMHPLSRKAIEHVVADIIGGDCKNWSESERKDYSKSLRSILDAVAVGIAKEVAQLLLRPIKVRKVE